MLKYDLFFLSPEDDIYENTISIKNKIETNHISSVLRKKVGDKIVISDGINYYYEAEILLCEKKRIEATIIEKFNLHENNENICLNISMLKGSTYDLQIEKAIEIGVKSIRPILTDHVVAKKDKMSKWNDVIKTALKQSKQPRIVHLHEPVKLLSIKKENNELWVVPEITENQQKFSELELSNKQIQLFIGPEGGFSSREIDFFHEYGATFHSLGENRLRAETAAWVSLVLLKQLKNTY